MQLCPELACPELAAALATAGTAAVDSGLGHEASARSSHSSVSLLPEQLFPKSRTPVAHEGDANGAAPANDEQKHSAGAGRERGKPDSAGGRGGGRGSGGGGGRGGDGGGGDGSGVVAQGTQGIEMTSAPAPRAGPSYMDTFGAAALPDLTSWHLDAWRFLSPKAAASESLEALSLADTQPPPPPSGSAGVSHGLSKSDGKAGVSRARARVLPLSLAVFASLSRCLSRSVCPSFFVSLADFLFLCNDSLLLIRAIHCKVSVKYVCACMSACAYPILSRVRVSLCVCPIVARTTDREDLCSNLSNAQRQARMEEEKVTVASEID